MKILLVLVFTKLIFCKEILIGEINKLTSKRHGEKVTSIKVLSDDTLATTSSDNTVKFWNLTNNRIIKSVSYFLIDHENSQHTFLRNLHWYLNIDQLKPGGDLVVSTYDQKTFLIDFKTKKFKERLSWGNTGFSLFDINQNGTLITVNTFFDIIYVWDMESTPKRVVKEVNTNTAIKFLKFYSENEALVASEDGNIQIFNLTDGQVLNRMSIPYLMIYAILVLPEEKLAVSTSKYIFVFNVSDGNVLFKLSNEGISHSSSIVLLENGDLVSGTLNELIIWDLEKKAIKKSINTTNDLSFLNILPNGNIVSGSTKGELHVWDIKKGKLVRELDGNDEDLSDVKSLLSKIDSKFHERILNEWNIDPERASVGSYSNFGEINVHLLINQNYDGYYNKTLKIFKIEN